MLKHFFVLIPAFFIAGCATTPAQQVDMRHYSTPTSGMAGIYFYQWKTGVYGALADVNFVLDGKVLSAINTGEWAYFEVPAGKHKYYAAGGLLPTIEREHQFDAGQNYFYRGSLRGVTYSVTRVNDVNAIEEAIQNIKSGRYEKRKGP